MGDLLVARPVLGEWAEIFWHVFPYHARYPASEVQRDCVWSANEL